MNRSEVTLSSSGGRPSPWERKVLSLGFVCFLALAPMASVGAVAIQDVSPPALFADATWEITWPEDWPEGWADNSKTVSATAIDADGLQGLTSQYRYSTDGGFTWTNWLPVVDHTSPVSTTVYMTVPVSSLVDSATLNRLQFRVTDKTPHVEVSPLYIIKVDGTAPDAAVGLAADPVGWASENDFTLTWTNPADLSGIAKAYYKFGDAPAHATDRDGMREGIGISQIQGVSVPGVGAIPCYVWLEDVAGNADHTTAVSVPLRYSGGVAPGPPFAMQISPNVWDATGVYTVTWTNPSMPSGIQMQAAWYKWDDPPAGHDDGARVAGTDIQRLEYLTPPGQGARILHVWLEDEAGVKDHNNRSTAVAQYDFAPPVTTPSFTPPLPPGGWFNEAVVVDLDASDVLSGVKETWWRREGGLWRLGTVIEATEYVTYHFYSVDNANNEEITKQVVVPIDKEAPTSYIITPTLPASGWYTDAVTIIISATDDLSGWEGDSWYRVDGGELLGGTIVVISGSGSHGLEYYSRDVAGNIEGPQVVAEVCRTDVEAPIVTATVGITETYVQPPVAIAFGASDQYSGVQVIEYRRQGQAEWVAGAGVIIDGSGGDGVYTYEYRARDLAGNVSEIGEISVNVDGTPPPSATDLAADPSEWVNENGVFGLSWTNPQDFSAVAGVYYQIDVDPTVALVPTRVPGDDISSLADLSVPGEGEHTIYVWLEDGAHNSDPFTRALLANAFKLDLSPPVCDEPAIEGPLGCNGFYSGPVTVTLLAHDSLSGVAAFHYRINGGIWISTPVSAPIFGLAAEGRQIVDYRSSDVAGNVASGFDSKTVYIDSVSPASPVGLAVMPSGWSRTNSFKITWVNPPDVTSGVGAAYVKKGSPPVADQDGVKYPLLLGQSYVSGITVGHEGETPAYVWLEDRACNVDYTKAVGVILKYDVTEPETIVTASGTLGQHGYYVSPVMLAFDATDNASGVFATYYRINGGTEHLWDGQDLALDQEGDYTITYHSVDHAGNEEWLPKQARYKLDLYPPTSGLELLTDYSGDLCVSVSWRGDDTGHGSGVEKYDVGYRRGGCGPWQAWLADDAATSRRFCDLEANIFHYFRVKAKDRAGWESQWSVPDEDDYVYREGLGNPSFDTCELRPWVVEGELGVYIVSAEAHDGGWSCMARLAEERGPDEVVPVGSYASLSQLITLPSLQCDYPLILSFWYRIQSYDVAWGIDAEDGIEKWFDPFKVYIRDGDDFDLELASFVPSGNFTDYEEWEAYEIYDSGWRACIVNLTSWAGDRIWIDFRLWNLVDQDWPTWAFVDGVKLQPVPGRIPTSPSAFLPLACRDRHGAGGVASGGLAQERAGGGEIWPEAWGLGGRKSRR